MNQAQQGDVQIKSVESVPVSAEQKQAENGNLILAKGEATGHAHRVKNQEGVRLFENEDGTLFLSVESEADLTHEEHDTITIPEGTYEVGPTYEVSPFEKMEREVID